MHDSDDEPTLPTVAPGPCSAPSWGSWAHTDPRSSKSVPSGGRKRSVRSRIRRAAGQMSAMRLFGAVEALREKTGVEDVSWSVWRAHNERDLARVREQLDAKTCDALGSQQGAEAVRG